MIRIILLFLFVIPFHFSLRAQNLVEDPSETLHLFNREKIVLNGIKSAEISIAFKYDLESIIQTGERILYEFDQNGLVKSKIEINPFKGRQDSIVTQYIRNKTGLLSMKVKTDPGYTYVEMFDYLDNKLIRHQYYQMKRTRKWNENLYDKHLMWSDSISYAENSIKVYNRYGKNYLNYHIKRNEKGKIIRNSTYDQNGRWLKKITVEYLENNPESIEEVNNNRLMFDWRKEFLYTESGLSEIHYFKNNQLEHKRKLSYNAMGLVELDLKRNESNKKMTILQFEYFRLIKAASSE